MQSQIWVSSGTASQVGEDPPRQGQGGALETANASLVEGDQH